jgi:hypothetical protein
MNMAEFLMGRLGQMMAEKDGSNDEDGNTVQREIEETFDLREVYDNEIKPLVQQIHDLCDQHNIPAIIYLVTSCDDECYSAHGTVHLTKERTPGKMYFAYHILHESGD